MNTEAPELFALLLAAGQSTRFGATKQLAIFEGKSLIQRALRNAEGVCGRRTVVVVGADWRNIANACRDMQGFLVYNERFADGIGASIASGVRAVYGTASGVLVMLADQPRITTAHLEDLIATWRQYPDDIVASKFADTVGPPIIFPASFFNELKELGGDSGARSVVRKHPEKLQTVDCEDCAFDVDRPEDLDRLESDGGS